MREKFTPNRVWSGIFALWILLLSGVLHSFLKTPGALQAFQLQQMLDAKQRQIDNAENQLIALQEDSIRLEKSRITQEREIRRVLGYVAPNELIFDFSGEETL